MPTTHTNTRCFKYSLSLRLKSPNFVTKDQRNTFTKKSRATLRIAITKLVIVFENQKRGGKKSSECRAESLPMALHRETVAGRQKTRSSDLNGLFHTQTITIKRRGFISDAKIGTSAMRVNHYFLVFCGRAGWVGQKNRVGGLFFSIFALSLHSKSIGSNSRSIALYQQSNPIYARFECAHG